MLGILKLDLLTVSARKDTLYDSDCFQRRIMLCAIMKSAGDSPKDAPPRRPQADCLRSAPARDAVGGAAGVAWGNLRSVRRWGWSRACNSVDITVMRMRGEK